MNSKKEFKSGKEVSVFSNCVFFFILFFLNEFEQCTTSKSRSHLAGPQLFERLMN